MADDPLADYSQPTLGSLTGFTKLTSDTGAISLPKTGWSLDQLQDFLLNNTGINFPSQDFITQLVTQITQHLADTNNPHHVTLDQIINNLCDDLFSLALPGTPPGLSPFFAYDAACGLDLSQVFPATYATTNFYRMTEGGTFVDPNTESSLVATDCVSVTPGLPLFASITNLVPAAWAQTSTMVNTTIVGTAVPTMTLPFPAYLLQETATTGQFGIIIPTSGTTQSQNYTFTIFAFPTGSGGSLLISQPNDSANNMVVDLLTGIATFSSTSVSGTAFLYPSGLVRINFSYTQDAVHPDNAVQILHINAGDSSPTRTGTNAHPIAIISQALVTPYFNYPVFIDSTKPASTSKLVADPVRLKLPATMQNILATLSFTMYPSSVTSLPRTSRMLLMFDQLTVTRTATQIAVFMGTTQLMAAPILKGRNTISISYSATSITLLVSGDQRRTATGTFPPLSTSAITIGPMVGYLLSAAIYALSDQTQCLEYLTNG